MTRREWSVLILDRRLSNADFDDLRRYKHAHGDFWRSVACWLASLPKARQQAALAQITARMGQ